MVLCGKNQVVLGHLIIDFPTSLGVSVEQVNGVSERANGQASDPVLSSRFLAVRTHCAVFSFWLSWFSTYLLPRFSALCSTTFLRPFFLLLRFSASIYCVSFNVYLSFLFLCFLTFLLPSYFAPLLLYLLACFLPSFPAPQLLHNFVSQLSCFCACLSCNAVPFCKWISSFES